MRTCTSGIRCAHYYPWLCDPEPIAFRYGDYSALRRPYRVDEYRADSCGWPVVKTVYVEAEWDPRDPLGEMNFIAQLRKEHRFPSVAIAQAWLDRADCAAVFEAQARHQFVRGIRHKPKPGMMADARWRDGYRRLAPLAMHFELQAPWPQLAEAARLARDFANTTIVLNHTGLPGGFEFVGWRNAMAELAGYVRQQLSRGQPACQFRRNLLSFRRNHARLPGRRAPRAVP
jgi:predicted TIM-barrel fold metal-dependent hydrolase